jgi:hypothetical protein
MVTDCGGLGAWDISDSEALFLQGSLSLLKVVIPATILFLVWRIYRTRQSESTQDTSIFSLKQTSMDEPAA